ncbi:hypothetical protein CB0940_09686 [Cercospora beticola]|uniref:Uncharacterized protein n=1 Tax=Cercospora beticola TaxID=122368 RepID=A0A2G5HHJ7_CERBT|nr:hypothetical protein CB0940_09686 [Cercospora beticola]PIA92027.1 hypothetical protein CB0940_09686 [Cercospora beticola]WPB05974.1 hypothetical protein RHO25_010629 [Cercospora beticola]CAK1365850.1 unnamed protein product [Cercospora beticola]
MALRAATLFTSAAALVAAADPTLKLKTYIDSLKLEGDFDPVIEAYWTGLAHHRRSPFAVSPDGKTGYLAYLSSSGSGVQVQHVDLTTFAGTGSSVTIDNVKEAGGLVGHNDGFALLGNEPLANNVQNAPPDGTPVPAIYRYTNGEQTFKTFVAGPGVHERDGLSMSPDMNGDLVWSEEAQLYGAYFVITNYEGDATGHFGDSIQYVNSNGTLEVIEGASSSWGCSHNTGIAFEAADEAPFASICAEDQGAIWLNTKGQGMSTIGTKISNEKVINGACNEAMGGMSGSYSSLARFINSTSYAFTWVSRGAVELVANEWMGDGYTSAKNRTNGRRVAISVLSDKLTTPAASSEVGAVGDSQVNWITPEIGPDRSNAHVAAFDSEYALVTWEQIDSPFCEFEAMGCRGTFSGTYFQLVNSKGEAIGEPLKDMDTYVAGDMVTMADGRICWPYVSMTWLLHEQSVRQTEMIRNATSVSFACMSLV